MQRLLKKADSIELKIKQMISKLELLEKENAFLKEENNNLIEKHKQQKGIIKALELKSNHKESEARESLNGDEKAKIKNEIDAHIEKIDQVIDVLKTY